MKVRTLAGALLAVAALPLLAATGPLWDAAEERAWRSRDFVAEVVTTRTEIADGDGETLEIVDEIERLTGWKAGQPVRTNDSKRTVLGKAGMKVKFNFSGNNVFVAAREGRLTRTFVRDETLNGRRCAVYRVQERPVPGRKEKALAGEVWIDRATAIPVQGVYRPVEMPPNVKSYSMTVVYGVVGERWGPARASIEIHGGNMFMKRRLKVEKRFSGWTPPVR